MKMKKLLVFLLILTILTVTISCGQSKDINGITYDTYGLLTTEKEDYNIRYKVIWGNVFWGVVLFETIISPIYFFGFSIFEPVEKRNIDWRKEYE